MKFSHTVKHNGINYLPGEEVPIGDNTQDIIDVDVVETPENTNVTARETELLAMSNKELLIILNGFGINRAANTAKVNLVAEIVNIEENGAPVVEQQVEEVDEDEETFDENHEPNVGAVGSEDGGSFISDVVND